MEELLTTMKRRIFVALPISPSLQKAIARWQKGHAAWPIRWAKPESLHITLIPPWWVEDPRPVLSLLEGDTLKRCHLFDEFALTFHRVTFGPDPKRPRLIWAEGDVPPELLQLKRRLEEALQQPSEKRAFKLHLTLARFRPDSFPNFPAKALDEKIDWQEEVKSLALLESHLSPAGATYEQLAVFPL